ncbi:PTS fructose-like transporter subunit IIB [Desulfovibrio sp. UCD-KL4C]|uniref:PTS fructose-like transporter subunit IIB n=1 Tax=Desulfovibrio sp. UCD-KL4C TaxID=2578120 RepID=UPI0025BC57CE|nr:PTS fructose-like transporter subunit IIB [Desulfovibrio sp. UCD-KL4C]
MSKIVAVTACPTGVAHTIMAAEALKKVGASMGHQVEVETQGAEGAKDVLSQETINAADVVIIAADIHVNPVRFQGKALYAVTTSEAIRNTKAIIEAALGEADEMAKPISAKDTSSENKFIIGVTSCPTGIAHTFMAAEALRKTGVALGYEVKIETQGSVGSKNVLTDEDIARADAVVIAADAFVDPKRFDGKPLYETSTKEALHDAKSVIKSALAAKPTVKKGLGEQVAEIKKDRSAATSGPYRHLMTGVSYMLPVVVAGGLMIALAFAFGGIYAGDQTGTLGWALMQIGGTGAFSLFVPVFSAFIAYSIAQRPGITAGIVGGLLATNVGAGFLGGIVAGFMAGYLTKFLNDKIKLPQHLDGLKPVLILPFLSTLVVGLMMIYVIGPPVKIALTSLSAWLQSMQSSSALALGLLLGAMMAFDMGGPVNKAAYTFGVGLLSAKIYAPMAAVMAAGMTPPLGLALAATFFKSRFTKEEHEASKAAFILGISFITEGAIPFAARDPFRVIPCIMLGSAVTGAISMVMKCTLMVPHGGIFVLPIPHAVTNILAYAIAIVIGTLITAGALFIVKRPLKQITD